MKNKKHLNPTLFSRLMTATALAVGLTLGLLLLPLSLLQPDNTATFVNQLPLTVQPAYAAGEITMTRTANYSVTQGAVGPDGTIVYEMVFFEVVSTTWPGPITVTTAVPSGTTCVSMTDVGSSSIWASFPNSCRQDGVAMWTLLPGQSIAPGDVEKLSFTTKPLTTNGTIINSEPVYINDSSGLSLTFNELVSATVYAPKLSLSKTGPFTAAQGDTIDYAFTLENSGNAPLAADTSFASITPKALTITEFIAGGLISDFSSLRFTELSALGTGWVTRTGTTATGITVTWVLTGLNLPVSSRTSLTLSYQLDGSSLSNGDTIVNDQYSARGLNAYGVTMGTPFTTTFRGPSTGSGLEVKKTAYVNGRPAASLPNPTRQAAIGDTISYTIQITNIGTTMIVNGVVSNIIPNNPGTVPGTIINNQITEISSGPNSFVLTNGTFIVAGGETIVLKVSGRTLDERGLRQAIGDFNGLGNKPGTSEIEYTSVVTVTGQLSGTANQLILTDTATVNLYYTNQVSLRKEASVTEAEAGETIVYTYTVQNNGDIGIISAAVVDESPLSPARTIGTLKSDLLAVILGVAGPVLPPAGTVVITSSYTPSYTEVGYIQNLYNGQLTNTATVIATPTIVLLETNASIGVISPATAVDTATVLLTRADMITLTDVNLNGPTFGKVNEPYDFTALVSPISATAPISYLWRATDQTNVLTTSGISNSVMFSWATPGVKYIGLTVKNKTSAAVSATAIITIAAPSVISLTQMTMSGPISGQVGLNYSFAATVDPISATTPITYLWRATDQTNVLTTSGISNSVMFSWATTGTKFVSVLGNNGTNDQIFTRTITILEAPITGLTASNNGPTSLGSATTLQASVATGSGVSYEWNFGDGSSGSGNSVNHTYGALGSYVATVTATNALGSVSGTTTVVVRDRAISGLTASNDGPAVVSKKVNFAASVSGGSNVNYRWNFGDGTTGSGASPNHSYTTPGTYTATVTASNGVGSTSATSQVTIFAEIDLAISKTGPSSVTVGEPIVYTLFITNNGNLTATNLMVADPLPAGASYLSGGRKNGSTVEWSIAALAGGSSMTTSFTVTAADTVVNDNYSVAAAGGYTATGTVAVTTLVETALTDLTAENNSPTPLGKVTTLKANVTNGGNISYRWEFGDGSNGTGQTVEHSYPAIGVYTATVTASNTVNSLTAQTVVTITGSPALAISKSGPQTVLPGGQVTYTLTLVNNGTMTATNLVMTDALPAGARYLDGGTLNNGIVSWNMAELGVGKTARLNFRVTTTQSLVNDSYGVVADDNVSAIGSVAVKTAIVSPTFSLSASNNSPTTVGSPTTLTAQVNVTGGVNFRWQFGDGTGGSGSTVQHVYQAAGTYTATVTASSGNAQAIATTVVTVIDTPPTNSNEIAGIVTDDTTGSPLAGIHVTLYRYNGSWWRWVGRELTNNDGGYRFSSLTVGQYALQLDDWSGSYLTESYDNQSSVAEATKITIPTSNRYNIGLSKGGQIMGQVTNSSQSPIADISVALYRLKNGQFHRAGWAKTDSNGQYKVDGLRTGEYRLQFSDRRWPNRKYPTKYYQNGMNLESADTISVTVGQTTANVDILLDDPGRISGRVTDSEGNPLANVHVSVRHTNQSWWDTVSWAYTNANGEYTVGQLGTSTYKVRFSKWPYVESYYKGASNIHGAADVSATLGSITPDIDGVLLKPVKISGKVVDAFGNPLSGIRVKFFSQQNGQWKEYSDRYQTRTNGAGHYETYRLAPGSYRVGFFENTGNFAYEFYDDATTIDTAADVETINGQPATGIDAQLSPPVPPIASVSVPGGSVAFDPQTGKVAVRIINRLVGSTSFTIRKNVSCDNGSTPSKVMLNVGGSSYPMTAGDTGNVISKTLYVVTVRPEQVKKGDEITISKTCGGETETEVVGKIDLYDPSGFVTDELTKKPIVGARVTLYNVPGWLPKQTADDNNPDSCQSHLSKAESDPWTQPAPTELAIAANPLSGRISPQTNPLFTNELGRYAWDVAEGCWYVVVEAEGYQSRTSPVVGAPPEVTDLDVQLSPNPALAFSATSYQVVEGASSITITVRANIAPTQTVSVDYLTTDNTAVANEDYQAASGTLTFEAGQTMQMFTVPILNDTTNEVVETFIISLTNPTGISLGGIEVASVAIINDDIATTSPTHTVQFGSATYQVDEAVGTAAITLTLSDALSQTASVDYMTVDPKVISATLNGIAEPNVDYLPLSGTLTFSAGQTLAILSLTILDDTVADEGHETVEVRLTNPRAVRLGTPATATLTIVDNDVATQRQYLPMILSQ